MNLISFRFLALVAVGLLLFHSFRSLTWRRLVLLVLNVTFIASFANSPLDLFPLAAFLMLGYLFILVAHSQKSRMNFVAGIFLLLLAFVYLKRYSLFDFLQFWENPYVVVGLSFIFFRVVQIFVDTHQGALVERISALEMFNYCCNFLTFVSGPIQRFQDYREQEKQLASINITDRTAYLAFSRITNGVMKLALISTAFEWLFEWMKIHSGEASYLWATYAGAGLSYFLQLFYNFSGYMDIVVGIGFLFGFKLPENFDSPLDSENFLDFWSRWHITLSEWFKLYLFNPIVKALTRRWMRMGLVPYFGVFAYFVTFFLMGMWHGTTFMFMIYGLFLGLGMAINKFYEIEMRALLGKARFKKLRGKFLYRIFSKSLTLTYFAIALTALWMKWDTFTYVLGRLGWIGILESLGLFILVIGFIHVGYMAVRIFLARFRDHLGELDQSRSFQQIHLAARVVIVILFLISSQISMPKLIYGGF